MSYDGRLKGVCDLVKLLAYVLYAWFDFLCDQEKILLNTYVTIFNLIP